MKPVWTFEQALHWPAGLVWALLSEVREGPFSAGEAPFLLEQFGSGRADKTGGDHFTVQYPQNRVFVAVDPTRQSVAVKGEWWYQGVHTVVSGPDGSTLLRLQVFNVAKRFRWAAALMILPEQKQHRLGFEQLVGRIQQRLSLAKEPQ